MTLRRCLILLAALLCGAADADEVVQPGLPDVQRPFAALQPAAKIHLGKAADWVEVTAEGVWVGGKDPDAVHRLNRDSLQDEVTVPLPGQACAGLAADELYLWVPVCGAKDDHKLLRIDRKSGQITLTLPFGPDAEGGVTVGDGAVWVAIKDHLWQIDAGTGRVARKIALPKGSFNPLWLDHHVWVAANGSDSISVIDAKSGKRLKVIATGPQPRFLTSGDGSVWTLNQGDGSVTRIDQHRYKVQASIALGLPGPGGDIAFDGKLVWVTMMGTPLTAIKASNNKALAQWRGEGGDSLKAIGDTIWLTDYKNGDVALFEGAKLP